MRTRIHHHLTLGALALLAPFGTTAALAEARQEQAARAVRQYEAPSAACALLTKDEVAKLTGRSALYRAGRHSAQGDAPLQPKLVAMAKTALPRLPK